MYSIAVDAFYSELVNEINVYLQQYFKFCDIHLHHTYQFQLLT